MPGTISGVIQAREKNYKRHGRDFYARIGKIGGHKGTTGGFGDGEAGRERAKKAGKIGGKISTRKGVPNAKKTNQ